MAEGNNAEATGAAGGVTDATKDQVITGAGGDDAAKAAADKATADKAAADAARANETPEQKTAREAAEKKAAGDKEKPQGAPETYTDFTIPEGITVDAKGITAFKDIAKKLNLTQEAAQELVTFQAGFEAAKIKEVGEFWDKQAADWLTAAKADKEIGGDEKTFSANAAIANKGFQAFATPELFKALQTYGLNNHPEVIRLGLRLGKAVSDDTIVVGGKNTTSTVSAGEAMFPTMFKK